MVELGLFTICMGEPVGPRFVQMVSKTEVQNGKFPSRLAYTLFAIHSNFEGESRTSLIIEQAN